MLLLLTQSQDNLALPAPPVLVDHVPYLEAALVVVVVPADAGPVSQLIMALLDGDLALDNKQACHSVAIVLALVSQEG